MVTVAELLSHPIFKNFELVTDRSGLNNRVRDSGIFEWETGDFLDENFHPGDFVITTLSPYRDIPDAADSVIKALLGKNLAALCIKDIYFNHVSEDILDLANQRHIPIFFFSGTYFDDIIFTIKNSLTAGEINNSAMKKARELVYGDINPLEAEMLARDINPYFHNNFICAFWQPRDRENKDKLLDGYAEKYHAQITAIDLPSDSSYTVMQSPHGIIAIFTDSRGKDVLEDGLNILRAALELDHITFSMGVSSFHKGISDVGIGIREAVYASVASLIDNTELSKFDNLGITRILCPLHDNYWIKNYYTSLMKRLRNYDEEHHSDLIATMETYIRCGGDINETAGMMFQHGNTIRYRLEKIYSVLDIKNDPDAKSQLFLLARLKEINEVMTGMNL